MAEDDPLATAGTSMPPSVIGALDNPPTYISPATALEPMPGTLGMAAKGLPSQSRPVDVNSVPGRNQLRQEISQGKQQFEQAMPPPSNVTTSMPMIKNAARIKENSSPLEPTSIAKNPNLRPYPDTPLTRELTNILGPEMARKYYMLDKQFDRLQSQGWIPGNDAKAQIVSKQMDEIFNSLPKHMQERLNDTDRLMDKPEAPLEIEGTATPGQSVMLPGPTPKNVK